MLPNWGFRNTVHAYHSEETVRLPLKPISGSSSARPLLALDEFVRTRVPEIKEGAKHTLKPYLFSGTLQTLYTFKADFHEQYPVYFAREIETITEDQPIELKAQYKHLLAGEFTMDYVVEPSAEELDPTVFKKLYEETLPENYPRLHPRCRYYREAEMASLKKSWSDDNNPITIILPGLAGGIQEAPIRATCHRLHSQGHHVVVLNQRGCSRSKITTPYLYTGLSTDDLKFIIDKFHTLYASEKTGPRRQFHVIGYSFGGLQLTNYLIKEGKNSKLTSAITISSPWDLNESMDHISRSISGHYFFEPAITFFLMRLVKNNMKALSENSEVFNQEVYDELKKKIEHTCQFDDTFTCKLVGLPSAKSYYYAASPAIQMYKIKTPLLVINSRDDPMISTDFPYMDVQRNPWIYMATADLGGHYSFIKNNGDFWFADVVENWIDSWKELDVQNPLDIVDNDWNLDVHYNF